MSYLDWRRKLPAKGSLTKDESVELKLEGHSYKNRKTTESKNCTQTITRNYCTQTLTKK